MVELSLETANVTVIFFSPCGVYFVVQYGRGAVEHAIVTD
jgi:hypothetical protein